MNKIAKTHYPVHELVARRWSPRAFSGEPVTSGTLGSLFEAARWAASCFNEQPWRFIVARREEPAAHETMLGCLTEGNRVWAAQAPVLMLGVAKRTFSRNGKPNVHARHDLGLATAGMMLQAGALDLYLHAMGGILPEKAAGIYRIPDDFEVATGIALGYLGDPDTLAEPHRSSELQARERKPLSEIVFTSGWGAPADFL